MPLDADALPDECVCSGRGNVDTRVHGVRFRCLQAGCGRSRGRLAQTGRDAAATDLLAGWQARDSSPGSGHRSPPDRRGEGYLLETLDADPGARALGELAFGTNFDITTFTKNILFDEKIGGTVHMALGAGYPETGSTNQSAIHWDLICDLREGGSVEVDGEPFMRDGRYLV